MPYNFPGKYFVHEDGRGRDSAFLIDQTDLTTASGMVTPYELVNIDHVAHSDDVMDNPTDYLWSEIENTAVKKPLVVWSVDNPTVIHPASSVAFTWTVTGTLPPDFTEPSTDMLTLGRSLYQSEVGEIQSEFIPADFLLVSASGAVPSGTNITFHPNEIPGYYDFAIAEHTDLWRQSPLRIVASGTLPALNPVISGAGQVSGWTLTVTETTHWNIYRRARRGDSSNTNDVSVDYEYGAVFLQNNGAISVLDSAGIETTVDLIANDGSLDIIIYGDDTDINITASGTNSDINLTASGSTSDINLLARGDVSSITAVAEGMSSAVVLVANGTNSLIDMEANGSNSTITMAANGDVNNSISLIANGTNSSIDLTAYGVGADINLSADGAGNSINMSAHGTSSTVQATADGTGSSIQLEATGNNSQVAITATSNSAGILLQGGDININPEDSFHLDGDQPGNPPMTFTAGAGNINFTSGNGGLLYFGSRTLVTGTLEAENAAGSFRTPQRTAALLTAEAPGSSGGGRIAWDSTNNLLKVWDRGTWQTVATGTGGGGISNPLTANLDADGFEIQDVGVLKVRDGLVGSPSITFQDDTDTGIYRPSSNRMDFVTGGNSLLYIDSDTVKVQGTSAFGLPQLSNASKDSLPTEDALVIFNTTSGTINTYTGTTWKTLAFASNPNGSVTATGVVTNYGNQFIEGASLDLRADSSDAGTTTTVNSVARDHRLFIHTENDFSIGMDSHGSNSPPGIRLYKSGGTHASPSATSSGTNLGVIATYAHDGTDYGQSARMRFFAKKTATAGNTPGQITFETTSEGAQTNSLRGTVDDDGWNFANHNLSGIGKVTAVSGTFSQKVGIGTTSPSEALHVVGEGLFTGNVELKNDADASLSFIIDSGATTTQLANFAFQDQGNGQWTIGKNTSNDFVITDLIGGVTPFTIQQSISGDSDSSIFIESTGDVGIGTGAPAYKLDVDGDVQVRGGDLYVDPQSGDTSAGIHAVSRGTGIPFFRMTTNGQTQQWRTDISSNNFRVVDEVTSTAPLVVESGTPTNLLVLDNQSNGRVGVRTASPATDFQVLGSGTMYSLRLGTNAVATSPGAPNAFYDLDLRSDKAIPIRIERGSTGATQIQWSVNNFPQYQFGPNAAGEFVLTGILGFAEVFKIQTLSPANSIVIGTTTSAQVGVGASPASGTLHVHGNGYFNTGVTVSGSQKVLTNSSRLPITLMAGLNTTTTADRYLAGINGQTYTADRGEAMPFAGNVAAMGVTFNCSAVTTGGNVHFYFFKNGSSSGAAVLTVNVTTTGEKKATVKFGSGTYTFTTGDVLSGYVDLDTFVGTIGFIQLRGYALGDVQTP